MRYKNYESGHALTVQQSINKKTKRGQTSAEFLLIMAAVFVVIIIGIIISQQQLIDINKTRIASQAKTTTDTLGSASREVYLQGKGARKRVFIEIPAGYVKASSSVGNRAIVLRAINTDYVATTDFDIDGTLPDAPGKYWVWVISEGNKVRIGTAMIAFSRPAISLVMLQNSTRVENFDIINLFTGPVNVSIGSSWTSADVSMNISNSSSTIQVNSAQTISLTFRADEDAVGYHLGSITATATSGSSQEVLLLPITVEVTIPPAGAPPIFIVPSVWNETLLPNQTVIRSFDVCTNSATTACGITFTTPIGPIAGWLGGLGAQLPAIQRDTCLTASFSLLIPAAINPGTYASSLTGQDSCNPNSKDTIAINLIIGGSPSDILGPIANTANKVPNRPFLGDPVTLVVTCNDTNTGNNSIKRAEVKVDGAASWDTMAAVDGLYDQVGEKATYTYNSLTFGNHNALFRCIDMRDNIGPELPYAFKVMKEILFVTKDEGLGGAEPDWKAWLDTHSSDENFKWNYDAYHRGKVNDGTVDTSLYATILMAEDTMSGSQGTQLVTKIVNFIAAGGYVINVDIAVDRVPPAFGIGNSDTKVNQNNVYIKTNSHYITSPYSVGTLQVYTTASDIYRIKNYIYTNLASDAQASISVALGDGGSIVNWGTSAPFRFNSAGNALTVRVFDYAILTSTLGTS